MIVVREEVGESSQQVFSIVDVKLNWRSTADESESENGDEGVSWI